jgi:hypothetical protein
MAKNEGINIPVGADTRNFVQGMATLSEGLAAIPRKTKPVKTAIDELNLSYRQTVKDAKNIALTMGDNSAAFTDAATKAQNLRNQIESVNESLYKATGAQPELLTKANGGFNTLNHSMNQITRELPAFTFSMQTGFMAISNNIPMLVDEINRLKIANREMIASGQQAPSMFKTIAGAIFSWQTALSLGITALTMFGSKMFSSGESSKKATDELEKHAKAVKQLRLEIADYLGSEQENEIRKEQEKYDELYNITKKSVDDYKDLFEVRRLQGKNLTTAEFFDWQNQKDNLAKLEETHQRKVEEIRQKYRDKEKKNQDEDVWSFGNSLQKELDLIEKNKAQIAASKEFWTGAKFDLQGETDLSALNTDASQAASSVDKLSNSLTVAAEKHNNFLTLLKASEEQMKTLQDSFSMLAISIGSQFAENLGRAMVGAKNSFDDLYALFAQIASEAANIMFMIGAAITLAPGAQGVAWGYFAAGAALKVVAGMLGGASANKAAAAQQQNNDYTGYNGYMGQNYSPESIQVGGIVRGSDLQIVLVNAQNQTRRVR